MELTDTTYNFVRQTMGILKKTVRDFKKLSNFDRYELREFAQLICIEFIGYRPKLDDPKYMQYRTIHNWEPQKGNLYGWLQRAINGGSIGNGRLLANFFRNGLLFPLLKQEGRLDVGNVAFQECDQSDCDYQAEYNGEACCGHDDCDGGIRIIRKTILIVPAMVYSPLPFWNCGNSDCGYYYESEKERCPYCGHERPMGPTATLLVYPQDVQYDKEGDEYNETPKQLTINRISRQQFTINGISRFSLAT
jgi:hypothetical protein